MRSTISVLWPLFFVLASILSGFAQGQPAQPEVNAPVNEVSSGKQMADILGINPQLQAIERMQSERGCQEATPTELALRQQVLESTVATSFDVDGVLAEISNERAHLSELRGYLESRKDQSANLINVATLLIGTGLGVAVNALQFSSSTANIGNGIGVGSGVATTALSIIGIRQRGPHHALGYAPNMLAPLLGGQPVLDTYYPPEVMQYLNSIPPGSDPSRGTRLQQLFNTWTRTGQLAPPGSPKRQKEIARLTASMNQRINLSIDNLATRDLMLGDVSGKVGLMKRDLAQLMRSLHSHEAACTQ